METGVFKIELKDNRIYYVFFANKTQKIKILREVNAIKESIRNIEDVISGIHTHRQWKKHFKHIQHESI